MGRFDVLDDSEGQIKESQPARVDDASDRLQVNGGGHVKNRRVESPRGLRNDSQLAEASTAGMLQDIDHGMCQMTTGGMARPVNGR